MDTTLVVNPGSASKKYALYIGTRRVLVATYEHVGKGYGKCVEINDERQLCEDATRARYDDALDDVLTSALTRNLISKREDITRVAVRIVAPGTYFQKHRLLTAPGIKKLETLEPQAPLHIPHTLSEIKRAQEALPKAKLIGVSDSAFHSTLLPHFRSYPMDQVEAKAHDLYRFGYHGLSVASVVKRVLNNFGFIPARMVICHVGSGVSVTTLKDGVSIDTSMGYAPGSGLMMGARAGDVDPGFLFALMAAKNISADECNEYLNTKAGFKGILGTNDLRIVLERYACREPAAELALAMYMARIHKHIAAAAVTLGGIDLLVLTATAAERNAVIREYICKPLALFGVEIDSSLNNDGGGRTGCISTATSRVRVLVVKTDEMGESARIATTL